MIFVASRYDVATSDHPVVKQEVDQSLNVRVAYLCTSLNYDNLQRNVGQHCHRIDQIAITYSLNPPALEYHHNTHRRTEVVARLLALHR